ncbi:hypothetical protein OROHE_012432 [Orobanche hederae]
MYWPTLMSVKLAILANFAQTLQSIGRNWRQFKTDLTGEYIYGPLKGLSPCGKYGISEDDWKEFKKTREDPTREEKRIKKQEIAKLNKAPHTMARGEYDFVVVREMERKLEERKKEASKSGEDVIIDPPSPPSRHQRWKLGRRTRAAGVSSDTAREIVTKIYLSKLNVGTMDDDLYGYFDPQSIQNMENKGEEASGYIISRMSDVKKQIYLGAHHHDTDNFWSLFRQKAKLCGFTHYTISPTIASRMP